MRLFDGKAPEPTAVFTPTKLPLAATNAYARREAAEGKLRRYLKRDQVPVVFGEYGVGKTTVVRRTLEEDADDGVLVYIATASGKSMSDIFRIALEELGFSVEVERSTSTGKHAEFGAKLVMEGSMGESSEESVLTRLVVDSPTDSKIASVLRDRKVTLVIDELHRATAELKSDIADLIKTTHGQESNYPQIVLIGTTLDSAELVKIDPGIDRFVKELPVSPMNEKEANSLITTGFDTLKMQIPAGLVKLIVETAAGAPSLIQSLCLEMAESALDRSDDRVTEDDYRAAVRIYLSEHGHRLVDAYNQAIEHTGPKRYKKQILIAMAEIDDEFFELEAVRARIEKRLGEPVNQTALSGPLRALKEGDEPILQDVTRRDGARVHNQSAFRDPMMKSFIRFMQELEKQGLVAD